MVLFSIVLLGCNTKAPESPTQLLDMGCYNRGDPTSCFELGTRELNAPRPNYAKARKLFSMGCGVHHAQSCNALGTLVRDARGGPKDLVRAENLFETACKYEFDLGCVHLADVLLEEDDEEKLEENATRAVELYTRTCDSESPIPKACTSLAALHLEGKGVEKRDKDRAMELYDKACGMDFAAACVERAKEYQATWGKDNMANAVDLLDKACRLDANHGCYELAQLHESKKAPEASIEQADHYYNRVCSMDHSRGCYERAELMAAEAVKSRPGEKEMLYKLACESGNSEACEKR